MEFKRGVYEMALTELARFVPHVDCRPDVRPDIRNHFLRGGLQARDPEGGHGDNNGHLPLNRFGAAFELPPGATFEPDPQTSLAADLRIVKT